MHGIPMLFGSRELKDKTITIRLTKSQKEQVNLMAERKGVNASKFIMGLIQDENTRQINAMIVDDCDNWNDDDLPF